MERQRVIVADNLEHDIEQALQQTPHDRLFMLADENTRRLCLPRVAGFSRLSEAHQICIGAGDTNKTIEQAATVWRELQHHGATRHSLLICVGGGMLTDLGGFAASTFKRGIAFINIPTTLLAQVDASVGGKTGVNFGGLKNEIGVFRNADFVILDTQFLTTLDSENIRSGYAEMLKHALISNTRMWVEHLDFNLAQPDLQQLKSMVAESVEVKQSIVMQDPHEQGIRKALNLGHTIGHAIESLAMEKRAPLLHGYAVAYGLAGELYLSARKAGFPTDRLHQTVAFLREYYGHADIGCNDYEQLLQLMRHDKKNLADSINFTLLGDIGDIRINQTATTEEITEALDFIREY